MFCIKNQTSEETKLPVQLKKAAFSDSLFFTKLYSNIFRETSPRTKSQINTVLSHRLEKETPEK